jgi:hypothetical protein
MVRKIQLFCLWSCFGWLFSTAYASTVTGDLNTVDSTVDSNNQSSTTTNNYNGAGAGKQAPVPTASSPSYMSNSQEGCLKGSSQGVQVLILGFSGGQYVQDEECNMRRDAKTLDKLGMKIAAVARMCQNVKNFRSMLMSGTPCPVVINGKLQVGKSAYLHYKMRPKELIPDYDGNEEIYNSLLGIGKETTNEETSTDSRSISERFRTSRRNTGSD